jgi:hypothetical protein
MTENYIRININLQLYIKKFKQLNDNEKYDIEMTKIVIFNALFGFLFFKNKIQGLSNKIFDKVTLFF